MIRRTLARLLTLLFRRLCGEMSVAEQWERLAIAPALNAFGPGSQNEFSWYFDGESTVAVSRIEDIHAWLATCTYADDVTLFRERDFWQHPVTFERGHAGDCEDFALWAWRKLVELGYDADFIIGYLTAGSNTAARHAWIVFRRDGAEYLYEPVLKDFVAAVQPLSTAMAKYTPEYGVGPNLVRHTYRGRLSVMLRAEAVKSPAVARAATSHLTPVAADKAADV